MSAARICRWIQLVQARFIDDVLPIRLPRFLSVSSGIHPARGRVDRGERQEWVHRQDLCRGRRMRTLTLDLSCTDGSRLRASRCMDRYITISLADVWTCSSSWVRRSWRSGTRPCQLSGKFTSLSQDRISHPAVVNGPSEYLYESPTTTRNDFNSSPTSLTRPFRCTGSCAIPSLMASRDSNCSTRCLHRSLGQDIAVHQAEVYASRSSRYLPTGRSGSSVSLVRTRSRLIAVGLSRPLLRSQHLRRLLLPHLLPIP